MNIDQIDQLVERAFVQSVRQGFGTINAGLSELDRDGHHHKELEAFKEKMLELYVEAADRMSDANRRGIIKQLLGIASRKRRKR
jgi:hypothetical protein